jgi:hypothetical protein
MICVETGNDSDSEIGLNRKHAPTVFSQEEARFEELTEFRCIQKLFQLPPGADTPIIRADSVRFQENLCVES